MNERGIVTSMVIGLSMMLTVSCGQKEKNLSTMTVGELKNTIRVKKNKIRDITSELKKYEKALYAQDSTLSPEVLNVTVDTVQRSEFVHYVNIQGLIESDEEIAISAEVGGIVIDLRVEEGQYVQKGQLIAIIDVESLRSQKNELETQYDLAKELYQRQKKLWDQKIGSEVQFLQAKNRKENLEKRIETLEVQLSKSIVYAGKAGTVESISIDEGEYAAPGAPILNLLNGDNLKVVADVPETYIKEVREGEEIKIEFPTLDTAQKSHISLVGSVINPSNRTIKIEAPVSIDDANLIKPNMLVMVYIKDYEKDNVIKIPIELVQQEVSGKEYVLVAERGDDGNMRASKQFVETGVHYNNQAVITEGLEVGELIIDIGARGLSIGARLNILTDKEAAALFSQSNNRAQ